MKTIFVMALAIVSWAGTNAARADDALKHLSDPQLLDLYKRLSAEDRYVAPDLNLLLDTLSDSLDEISMERDGAQDKLCKSKTSLMATYRQVMSTVNMLNPETRKLFKGALLLEFRAAMEDLNDASCSWFVSNDLDICLAAIHARTNVVGLKINAREAQLAQFFAASAVVGRSTELRRDPDRNTIETDPVRKEIAEIGGTLFKSKSYTVTPIGGEHAAPAR